MDAEDDMGIHESVVEIMGNADTEGLTPTFPEDALNRIVEDWLEDFLDFVAEETKKSRDGGAPTEHSLAAVVAKIADKRRAVVQRLAEFIREEVEFK